MYKFQHFTQSYCLHPQSDPKWGLPESDAYGRAQPHTPNVVM